VEEVAKKRMEGKSKEFVEKGAQVSHGGMILREGAKTRNDHQSQYISWLTNL